MNESTRIIASLIGVVVMALSTAAGALQTRLYTIDLAENEFELGETRGPAGSIFAQPANRFPQNDSNHRDAISQVIYNQMLGLGWLGEGIVFCVPV